MDLCDDDGKTALMVATENCVIKILFMLIISQANPLLTDKNGRTARDIAIESNHPKFVKYLEQYEADYDLLMRGRLTYCELMERWETFQKKEMEIYQWMSDTVCCPFPNLSLSLAHSYTSSFFVVNFDVVL